MHAVRLESIMHLAHREVPRPRPGADELLVRVEAAGVCGSDRHFYHGDFPCSPPVTLGHEFCGIVEEVGGAIGDIGLGTRVTADPNIMLQNIATVDEPMDEQLLMEVSEILRPVHNMTWVSGHAENN